MRRSYVVEVLFTLTLFTLFVAGSFLILLNGARGYHNIVDSHENMEEVRLPLAYLSTRMHQSGGTPVLQNINGIDCLVFSEDIDGQEYDTVVFYAAGSLYETFAAADRIDFEFADKVLDVSDLSMKQDGNRFIFTATNKAGVSRTLAISGK